MYRNLHRYAPGDFPVSAVAIPESALKRGSRVEKRRSLAPRVYEGGGPAKRGRGECEHDPYSPFLLYVPTACRSSPSQKSEIFDSPLINARAEAASPLYTIPRSASLGKVFSMRKGDS